MMKIVQTPVRFYSSIGGVENYVYNLSKELVKRGHKVTVICANEPNTERKETINGVDVKRLLYLGKIANTNITPTFPLELFKEDFDIIHTHLPTPWSADWSVIFAKLKKRPVILTYHNDIVAKGFANYIAKFYNLTSLNLVLRIAKKIIITQPKYFEHSPYLKEYKDKIEVVPVGVDTERFKPLNVDEEEHTLLFLSILDRFHEYKGLGYLLKALKTVKNEIKDVKLIVGGDGELKTYYQEMANRLGIGDNVEFVGFIPDSKLVEYYNRCSVFVLPSYSSDQEGFGIVLLEALACGKPVVTTEIVGVSNDVHEFNAGIVVKPCDVKSLADAILGVLQDSDLRRRMGKNGRKIAEKYSWKKVAGIVEKIYTELVGR